MFDRPHQGERALLVQVIFPEACDPEALLTEFRLLASSAGVTVEGVVTAARQRPDPKYFVGEGKAEEIQSAVSAFQAEVVLFNHALSPSQERNLEALIQCRVLDRTGLILDIFAQRARTNEGNLQVELAQLKHLSTRLVRGWTHLERQRGGVGLRGPGETQLETDRRLIAKRIQKIEARLEVVKQRREQARRSRRKADCPVVSLVGYTNAGKSTLFNRLTGAEMYVADQLFATLDTTLRKLPLQQGQSVILADTVGFIRELPHDLVAAFRATLEETTASSLLLHVIDTQDPQRDICIQEVNRVLNEIGAGEIPQIHVFNKADALGLPPSVQRNGFGKIESVTLSAATGAGCELLSTAITEWLQPDHLTGELSIPPEGSSLRARLYQIQSVLSEKVDSQTGYFTLRVRLRRQDFIRLQREKHFSPEWLVMHQVRENIG